MMMEEGSSGENNHLKEGRMLSLPFQLAGMAEDCSATSKIPLLQQERLAIHKDILCNDDTKGRPCK